MNVSKKHKERTVTSRVSARMDNVHAQSATVPRYRFLQIVTAHVQCKTVTPPFSPCMFCAQHLNKGLPLFMRISLPPSLHYV